MTSHTPTHYPQPGSVQIALNAPILLNFNGPVEPNQGSLIASDVNGPAKIQIIPSVGFDGRPLGLSVSISGNTITVNHSTPFDTGTAYVVAIKSIATSDHAHFIDTPPGQLVPVSGAASNPFTFRSLDTTVPYIDSHSPTNNDLAFVGSPGALPGTGAILILFNKAMNPDSVSANTTLIENTYLGTTVDLKPNAVFAFDQTGTALSITPKKDINGNLIPWLLGSKSIDQPSRITVLVGGQDIVGNVLGANPNGVTAFNQNPVTFRIADTIPPGLASASPAAGEKNVAPLAPVVLRFDEPVNCGTFIVQSQPDPFDSTILIYGVGADPASIDLPLGGVTATCSDNNRTVTLSHSFAFGFDKPYAVRILGQNQYLSNPSGEPIQDMAGNRLPISITIPFTAGPAVMPGDLDGDGRVDSVDVHLILLLYLGVRPPSPLELAAGDVRPKRPDGSYGDARIGSDDVNWVFRRFMGLETAP